MLNSLKLLINDHLFTSCFFFRRAHNVSCLQILLLLLLGWRRKSSFDTLTRVSCHSFLLLICRSIGRRFDRSLSTDTNILLYSRLTWECRFKRSCTLLPRRHSLRLLLLNISSNNSFVVLVHLIDWNRRYFYLVVCSHHFTLASCLELVLRRCLLSVAFGVLFINSVGGANRRVLKCRSFIHNHWWKFSLTTLHRVHLLRAVKYRISLITHEHHSLRLVHKIASSLSWL